MSGPARDAADERQTIRVEEAEAERLDRYLARRLPELSRSRIARLLETGRIRLNGRLPRKSERVAEGDIIEVAVPAPEPSELSPEAIPIQIVYQDRDLAVIDKPAGLVVHPAAGNWRGTLMNGLLHLDARQATLPRAGIVHRLDKDTSGLMVVARSETARMALAQQLADRSMSRRYLAIVRGRCPEGGRVDAPIGRDPANRLRMAVVAPGAGRAARTGYRRLAVGMIAGREVSLVECRLHTGRTHQVRVHMRSIGHPLLGDALYGGPTGEPWPSRQMLHAWRLSFVHPGLGRCCTWTSDPPEDFMACLRRAGLAEALALLAGDVEPEA